MFGVESVIDVMRKRHSIRTFNSEPLTESDLKLINDFVNLEKNLSGPFGKKGRMALIPVTNNVTDKGIKLGTYGFIKNPKAYVVGITKNDRYSLMDFAYSFQKLVLYLTGYGLGSCWMGGTFSRDSFEKEITLESGEFIPCITPVGYPNVKQRVFDKAIRYVVKADNKKPWNKLFYDGNYICTLEREAAGSLEIPIEMVRLGPSASNKQPWRLVLSKDRNSCYFFIEHTPNYSTKLGYEMQLLDMGIAMCQFELACREIGIDGKWDVEDPGIQLPNELTEYLVSWKMNS